MEVNRYARQGCDVLLIGHDGHPEVEGTMGRFDTSHGGQIRLIETVADAETVEVNDAEKLAVVTQTTLSVDDTADIAEKLRERFPAMATPKKEDICYATTNRQEAVKSLARQAEVMLVVGAANSSNSNRLRELAEKLGCRAYLINDAAEIDGAILTKADADSNGGAAISVAHVTGKPILFLGVGQGYEDMERFDPDRMVDRLLADED
jgi:4-hydroxy-3-methylbut-2-enyl diphosphate reductase